MSLQMLVLIAGGLLVLAIIVVGISLVKLSQRVTLLSRGKNGASLEDAIHTIEKHIGSIKDSLGAAGEKLQEHDKKLAGSVRGIGVVRFNPFEDSGGNQSFALALLDETGSGVVISSLFARERASVYSKPITNFISKFELTEEEKKAIEEAKGKL